MPKLESDFRFPTNFVNCTSRILAKKDFGIIFYTLDQITDTNFISNGEILADILIVICAQEKFVKLSARADKVLV